MNKQQKARQVEPSRLQREAGAPVQQQALPAKQEIVKPAAQLPVVENRGALVTSSVPEYLKQDGPILGIESWRPSDIKIARFQLAQETTKAAKRQNQDFYIDGLEPGKFYNSSTKEVFGNEVFFQPILKTLPKRARMPEEYTGSGGPLCRSENGKYGEGDPGGVCRKCAYSLWVDGKPPLCNELITYHLFPLPQRDYVPTPEDWCVWGAKKSAIKAAQYFGNLILFRGPFDLFKGVYKMTSFWDTNQTQPCWVPKVENAGNATPEQLATARAFFPALRNLELAGQIRVDQIVDEDEPIDVQPNGAEPGEDRPPF